MPAVRSSAQSIDSYKLRFYNVGAASLISTPSVLQASRFSCNQPAPTGPTVNPTKIVITDPSTSARCASYTDVTGRPLLSIPLGTFEGTIAAADSVAQLESPEGRSRPFITSEPAACTSRASLYSLMLWWYATYKPPR